MVVTMKDFSVMIMDLPLDKHTQDQRIIKMKIWMHINKILKSLRTPENNLQIVDITMSMYNKPNA